MSCALVVASGVSRITFFPAPARGPRMKFEPTHVGCYETSGLVPMARLPVALVHVLPARSRIRREPDHFFPAPARGPRMKFEPTHVGCYQTSGLVPVGSLPVALVPLPRASWRSRP